MGKNVCERIAENPKANKLVGKLIAILAIGCAIFFIPSIIGMTMYENWLLSEYEVKSKMVYVDLPATGKKVAPNTYDITVTMPDGNSYSGTVHDAFFNPATKGYYKTSVKQVSYLDKQSGTHKTFSVPYDDGFMDYLSRHKASGLIDDQIFGNSIWEDYCIFFKAGNAGMIFLLLGICCMAGLLIVGIGWFIIRSVAVYKWRVIEPYEYHPYLSATSLEDEDITFEDEATMLEMQELEELEANERADEFNKLNH